MKVKIFWTFTLLIICLLTLSACSKADTAKFANGTKANAEAPISLGVNVIVNSQSMALSAQKGESVRFSADVFARALNLSEIETVTLTSIPPASDGELRVGSTVVTGEQTLSAAALSLMTYSASPGIKNTELKFRVNNLPYEMTCKLYSLDAPNYAPTFGVTPQIEKAVSTYQSVTYFGTLSCYDPDGDESFIEVVGYPEKGILIFDNAAVGSYRYIPYDNASGKDSFVCVARDKYGNYSPSLTVSLEIKRSESSARFVDLTDSPYHNAALCLNEKGIMSGTQVGTSLYFYPDREVSRAEFIAMTMSAAGINNVNKIEKTVFADDADIPENMKSYIGAAYDLGYIKGTLVDGKLCFEPMKTITRAEAAVMLANFMKNIDMPTYKPVFDDADSIPSWAQSSLSGLCAIGVISKTENGIEPNAKVTRADAAVMLANFMSLK